VPLSAEGRLREKRAGSPGRFVGLEGKELPTRGRRMR
jgi:hypothetical protein